MRQAARLTGAARETVARRMRYLGAHCRAYHEAAVKGHGLAGVFLMDELETFETDRLIQPVTVPVLIQGGSLFVIHVETAPLPSRGRLDAYRTLRKMRYEARFGVRKSGSRAAVESTLLQLRTLLKNGEFLHIRTDKKSTYRALVRRHFAKSFGSHELVSSKRRRTRRNPLFAINHTLAMMRDGVSRLVRRSWGASKLRERLDDHLWIWISYRNYIRPITVETTTTTPAMVAGVSEAKIDLRELLRWRWPSRMMAQ